MAEFCGFPSLDAMIDSTVPAAIRRADGVPLRRYTEGMAEAAFLDFFKEMASKNTSAPSSGWATTGRTRPPSSCATCSRTRAGTRNTRLTRRRSRRGGSSRCSTSRRPSATSRA